MSASWRKTVSGGRILIHPCDECGVDRAPFGFRKPAQPSRWYCSEHREIGERWMRGES